MYEGKYVLSQIVSLIPQYHFNKSVERYKGDYRSRDLKSWSHFIYLLFGQLTHRESVRDIITCLSAHKPKLYHFTGLATAIIGGSTCCESKYRFGADEWSSSGDSVGGRARSGNRRSVAFGHRKWQRDCTGAIRRL